MAYDELQQKFIVLKMIEKMKPGNLDGHRKCGNYKD